MKLGIARLVVFGVSGALLAAPFRLIAQTADTSASTPVFEAASIHQNMNPNPSWDMSFSADGLHAKDVTLLWALHDAYGVSDSDLMTGGPAWLDKARFDIEAKYNVSG